MSGAIPKLSNFRIQQYKLLFLAGRSQDCPKLDNVLFTQQINMYTLLLSQRLRFQKKKSGFFF